MKRSDVAMSSDPFGHYMSLLVLPFIRMKHVFFMESASLERLLRRGSEAALAGPKQWVIALHKRKVS